MQTTRGRLANMHSCMMQCHRDRRTSSPSLQVLRWLGATARAAQSGKAAQPSPSKPPKTNQTRPDKTRPGQTTESSRPAALLPPRSWWLPRAGGFMLVGALRYRLPAGALHPPPHRPGHKGTSTGSGRQAALRFGATTGPDRIGRRTGPLGQPVSACREPLQRCRWPSSGRRGSQLRAAAAAPP